MNNGLAVDNLDFNVEEQESFRVTDASSADWALMKLREVAKQEELDNKLYNENLGRIDAWRQRAKERTDRDREYFEGLLDDYMREQLKEDPKYKLSTPNGRLSATNRTTWTHDDTKLLERLEGTEFIKTTQKVKWGDFKKTLKVVNGKAIDENGEIVEGVTAEKVTTINIKTEM